MNKIRKERMTVTAQISEIDETFIDAELSTREEKRIVTSKSDIIRQGLAALRRELGYNEKTGLKKAT